MDSTSLETYAQSYIDGNSALRDAIGVAHGAPLFLRYLAEGEHNRNFVFTHPHTGKHYVLRVNLAMQPFHNDQIAYEANALDVLAGSGCTPRPYYWDSGPDTPGNGILVMDYCKGHTLDFDNLAPTDLAQAACAMADVHAVELESHCGIYRPESQLEELFLECMHNFEVYIASVAEDTRITSHAKRFIEVCKREASASFQCESSYAGHILNAEPLASHFLVSTGDAQGRRAAFIDWERPIVGEVAQDLGYFLAPTSTFWDSSTLITREDADAFVDMYWAAVDGRFAEGAFYERFDAYRRIAILRAICWCCKALTRMLPGSGAHITQKAKDKVGIYLSEGFLEELYTEYFL